jgi:ADP-ribosyl-[dinitrogen reductase] hydrolase
MALRSSISDPLRIDSTSTGERGGRIGMTFCPGKNQPSSITGGWNRDLGLDLSAIRDWGAEILVSLLEPHEFLSVRVSRDDISHLSAALGIEWIDAPIVDGCVPSASFLVKWRLTVPRLRSVLDRGGAVVLCCMGGLGRTGMMTACLLVEAGYAPDVAISAVRAARPGAIETKAQEDFVLNYQIWG